MLVVFFAILFSLIGGSLGILVRSSITSHRRDTIAEVVLICLWWVAGGVFAVLGTTPGLMPALVVSLLAALGIVRAYVHFHRRSLSDLQKLAPAVREFGLDNFNRLDGDGDGLITVGDLFVIEDREDLSANDREMVRRIRRLLPRIGHCIDYTVIIGTIGGPATPVFHYGISRADLEKYPAKAQAEYDKEFLTK